MLREYPGRVFFPVGSAILLCSEPCTYPTSRNQHVEILQDGKLRRADELWPAMGWSSDTDLRKGGKKHVSYDGEYPDRLFAFLTSEECVEEERLPALRFVEKRWVNTPKRAPGRELPPRRYDAALLSAPFWPESFAYGAGAPPMIAGAGQLCLHDVKWSCKAAPWRQPSELELSRLANGTTLAAEADAIYLISAAGQVDELRMEEQHPGTVVAMAGEAWISGWRKVSRPTHPERFKLAKRERREVNTHAVDLDNRFASDAAPYSDQCHTPAVTLWHHSGARAEPGELVDAIGRHARQLGDYEVYQARFAAGYQLVVAAPTKKLAEELRSWIPRTGDLLSDLRCIDLRSQVPNPYAPSASIQRIFIHAASGKQLDLVNGKFNAD